MGEIFSRWEVERELYSEGKANVAGIDEVGRGCLAGPVVAASVILPKDCGIKGITDSKLIPPKRRESLSDEIIACAVSVGIALVPPEEIDRINILKASLLAMRLSVDKLNIRPDYLLIDGRDPIDSDIPQRAIIKGDQLSASIGAASIVAKVFRDKMMAMLEREHPGFSFSAHKGYGTAKHIEELQKHGLTPLHRRTFLKKYDHLIQR